MASAPAFCVVCYADSGKDILACGACEHALCRTCLCAWLKSALMLNSAGGLADARSHDNIKVHCPACKDDENRAQLPVRYPVGWISRETACSVLNCPKTHKSSAQEAHAPVKVILKADFGAGTGLDLFAPGGKRKREDEPVDDSEASLDGSLALLDLYPTNLRTCKCGPSGCSSIGEEGLLAYDRIYVMAALAPPPPLARAAALASHNTRVTATAVPAASIIVTGKRVSRPSAKKAAGISNISTKSTAPNQTVSRGSKPAGSTAPTPANNSGAAAPGAASLSFSSSFLGATLRGAVGFIFGKATSGTAAPASTAMPSAPSSPVRSPKALLCPNDACKAVVIGDVTLAPAVLASADIGVRRDCCHCSSPLCLSCGKSWLWMGNMHGSSGAGTVSHTGKTCDQYAAAMRMAIQASSILPPGHKNCPGCGIDIFRPRGDACHNVICNKCQCNFCYVCVRKESNHLHGCPQYCAPECDCVPLIETAQERTARLAEHTVAVKVKMDNGWHGPQSVAVVVVDAAAVPWLQQFRGVLQRKDRCNLIDVLLSMTPEGRTCLGSTAFPGNRSLLAVFALGILLPRSLRNTTDNDVTMAKGNFIQLTGAGTGNIATPAAAVVERAPLCPILQGADDVQAKNAIVALFKAMDSGGLIDLYGARSDDATVKASVCFVDLYLFNSDLSSLKAVLPYLPLVSWLVFDHPMVKGFTQQPGQASTALLALLLHCWVKGIAKPSYDHMERVDAILAAGANLAMAGSWRQPAVPGRSHEEASTPLLVLSRRLAQPTGKPEALKMIERLLDAGVDPLSPNAAGETPFQFAVLYYIADNAAAATMMKSIMRFPRIEQTGPDRQGKTLLMQVLSASPHLTSGAAGLALELICMGEDVHAKDNTHKTALWYFLRKNKEDSPSAKDLARAFVTSGAHICTSTQMGSGYSVAELLFGGDCPVGVAAILAASLTLDPAATIYSCMENWSRTPLECAIRLGKRGVGVVEAVLRRGADPNVGVSMGLGGTSMPALAYAVRAAADDDRVVTMLLEAGANVNARDSSRQSAYSAVFPAVSYMPRIYDVSDKLALLMAKHSGFDLALGVHSPGKSALHLALAARRPCVSLVKLLISKGSNVTEKDSAGRTPLEIVAEDPFLSGHDKNRFGAALLLLEAGATPCVDSFIAACTGLSELAALFSLLPNWDVNGKPAEPVETALQVSARLVPEVALTLLQRGADPKTHGIGGTTLHSVTNVAECSPARMSLLRAIIDSGIELCPDLSGSQMSFGPLLRACNWKNGSEAVQLITSAPSFNSNSPIGSLTAAFSFFAVCGVPELPELALKLLMAVPSHMVEMQCAIVFCGETALSRACRSASAAGDTSAHIALVQALLARGAFNLSQRVAWLSACGLSAAPQTSAYAASNAVFGPPAVSVLKLLATHPLLNINTSNEHLLLDLCTAVPLPVDLALQLLKRGVQKKTFPLSPNNPLSQNGSNELHCACRQLDGSKPEHIELIRALLAIGVSPILEDYSRETPFALACKSTTQRNKRPAPAIAELLYTSSMAVRYGVYANGSSALHLACAAHPAVVGVVRHISGFPAAPIAAASAGAGAGAGKRKLAGGAAVLLRPTLSGLKLKSIAIELNKSDNSGHTPLMEACRSTTADSPENLEVMRLLLNAGCDVNKVLNRNERSWTALTYACQGGVRGDDYDGMVTRDHAAEQAASLLLSCDRFKAGPCDPFRALLTNGSPLWDVARMVVLSGKASLEQLCSCRYCAACGSVEGTPLSFSCNWVDDRVNGAAPVESDSQVDFVDSLLNAGVEVSEADYFELFSGACMQNNRRIAALLVSAPQLKIRDFHTWLAYLELATKLYGPAEAVQILISRYLVPSLVQAKPSATGGSGPLLPRAMSAAAKARKLDAAYSPQKFDINAKCFEGGSTLLHLVAGACYGGGVCDGSVDVSAALVSMLLQHGASPNIPDSEGRLPFDCACTPPEICGSSISPMNPPLPLAALYLSTVTDKLAMKASSSLSVVTRLLIAMCHQNNCGGRDHVPTRYIVHHLLAAGADAHGRDDSHRVSAAVHVASSCCARFAPPAKLASLLAGKGMETAELSLWDDAEGMQDHHFPTWENQTPQNVRHLVQKFLRSVQQEASALRSADTQTCVLQ